MLNMLLVGNRIKDKREQKNISLNDLASELHVDINYISYLENGQLIPTTNTLIKLSQAIDMKIDEMFNTQIYDFLNTLDDKDIVLISPYLSLKTVDKIVKKLFETEGIKALIVFAPYCSKELINELFYKSIKNKTT